MKAIGGFFELELSDRPVYRENELLFNSGRSALAFLLKKRNIKSILLPYYTCEVLLEPLEQLGINYSFYSINEQLLPDFNDKKLKNAEAIIVNNYFGILDKELMPLTNIHNIIFDNAQAFYSSLIGTIGTFYSFRKFFGLADGASLVTRDWLEGNKKYERFNCQNYLSHLTGRIENGPESHYSEFVENDRVLSFDNIRRISRLSEKIYHTIDHESIMHRRQQNFAFLHKHLRGRNKLRIELLDNAVPMVYPLHINEGKALRKRLIGHDIYNASYWPNRKISVTDDMFEHDLINNLVALPIDQRYGKNDMKEILKRIDQYEA